MIDVGELKKGIVLQIDGQMYQVLDFQHIKMGRGSAQIRLRLRDVKAGHTTEKSFQASEKFDRVDLDRHLAQYQYNDNDLYYFMDTVTFEQFPVDKDMIASALDFIKEGVIIEVFTYHGQNVSIEMPLNVDLAVIETGPNYKGNTASAGGKPAKLETGIIIQVPFFINTGDVIKIDTRSKEYLERIG